MTLLSRRRRRTRQPVPAADFPADAADTDTLGRIPDWDGTTIVFGGASDVGLPEDDYDANGWDTEPPAQHPGPATLPVLPPGPTPRRPADCAIWTLLADGFGLLCGMDRWRRHADPEAVHYRNQFDALRVSALRAGWLPDLYGRWCCPRCVMDPAYATPKPVDHYHPGVAHARFETGLSSRECWQLRPATEYHRDAAAAFAAGDPAAGFWFRIQAEAEVLARTAEGGRHGRHGTHEAGSR